MLFFELFPALIMIVSLIVGISLFVADRRAPDDDAARERSRRAAGARSAGADGKTASAPVSGRRTGV